MIIIPTILQEKQPKAEASISSAYSIMVDGQSVGRYIQLEVAQERALELSEITGKMHTVERL